MNNMDLNKAYTEKFNKHYEYVKNTLLNTSDQDILVIGLLDSLVYAYSQQLDIKDSDVTMDTRQTVTNALDCLSESEDKVQALLLLMKTVSEILFKSVVNN